MNIFDIIKNLFTNPSSKWILTLEDSDIQSVVIQRFLAQEKSSMKVARLLDKYVYEMPPKMYLGCAWSLLFFNNKKFSKAPHIKYTKKIEPKHKYHFIYPKLQRQLKLSDKDLELNRKFIDAAIDKDKVYWFCYYGVRKIYWSTHNIDFDSMKNYSDRTTIKAPIKPKSLFDF